MNKSEEHHPLTAHDSNTPPVETEVYTRRWYVLGVFCYAGLVQATIWNTWGPITETTKVLLGWTDSNIALLTNLNNISFCLMVIPTSMLMDRKGLRLSLIMSATMFIVATGLRCITLESKALLGLSCVCAVISGTASIIPFAGPSLVSAVWFPLNQRTTATAIASTSSYIGFAFSFLLGPLFVTNPKYVYCFTNSSHNGSLESFSTQQCLNESTIKSAAALAVISTECSRADCADSEEQNVINTDKLESGVRHFLLVHLGLTAFLLVLTLAYFPSRPPKPPSYTASMEKPDYMEAGKQLVKNWNLWLVVVAGGLPLGVQGCWSAILDVNLGPVGVQQTDAGWIGFWQILAGCITGLVTARFSDLFMRKRKLFVIFLYILSASSCLWFVLLYNHYIEFNLPSVYAACILMGAITNSTVPLFYEMSCEASYPVAEGVTGGFYTLVMNLFGIIFLFILNIENVGVAWMNWVLFGVFLVCIPILMVFPEELKRTKIDQGYNTLP